MEIFRDNLTARRGRSAFTMIELLIVVAILGVILATALPSYASLRSSVVLRSQAEEIVAALRLAQSKAMTAQDGTDHGVKFDTASACKKFAAFSTTYESWYPTLPCSMTLTTAAVPPTQQVVFKRLNGKTDASDLTITVGLSGSVRIIRVDTTGRISIQ